MSSRTVILTFFGRFEAACETHAILPVMSLHLFDFPYILMLPLELFKIPRIANIMDVLPLPLGPTKPRNSPSLITKSTSFTIVRPPRETRKLLSSSTGVPGTALVEVKPTPLIVQQPSPDFKLSKLDCIKLK